MGGIDQCANFELFESQSEHPVARCSANISKSVPARHRPEAIYVCQLRRGDILVNVDGFVAVVPCDIGATGCKKKEQENIMLDM